MSETDSGRRKGVTRRRFLATTGAAATLLHTQGALARGAPGAPTESAPAKNPVGLSGSGIHHGSPLVTEVTSGGRASLHQLHTTAARETAPFARMFPNLPAHNPTDEALVTLARRIPAGPARNPDNPAIPAGFTFLGQFMDHDVTFDEVSDLLGSNDPDDLTSTASPRFDLDSVYGDGPSGSPELYDPGDPMKLLVVFTNGIADIPRLPGQATIADPRNDQHKIIVHIHLAVMRFHNAVVARLRSLGTPEASVFSTAQQLVRWHYQWVILKDYLPRTVGQSVVNSILVTGAGGLPQVVTRFYKPSLGNATMPVEFSVAAFRFGHSQIRDAYRIGTNNIVTSIFPRLNGGSPITSQTVVLLGNFFSIAGLGRQPQASKRIDGALSRPLADLPTNVTGDTLVPNLAERNLRRGKAFGLPSGQQVAAAIGAQVISNAELGLTDPNLQGEAPLWLYIMREAELQQGGARLGQVGGVIVAEVLLGMMGADPNSFINANPTFQPVPPIAPAAGVFTMGDLVRFSGAPV